MPAIASNIVQKLHRLHSSIQARGRLDTRDAIQAGELLVEVKKEQKRHFLVWFKENESDLGFGYRTGNRYIRLHQAKCDSTVNNLADLPLIEAYEAAGIIKEIAEKEHIGGESRGLGEVSPSFEPIGNLRFERKEAKVPHSVTLSTGNWRQEILALLSDERAFEKVLKAGGLALLFK